MQTSIPTHRNDAARVYIIACSKSSFLSTYISWNIFSRVVDISLLSCFCAVHVLLNKSVVSKATLTHLAAWLCCLFIQGFAKKAKFLREHMLLAACISACLHKSLCAWLVVSWEKKCNAWRGYFYTAFIRILNFVALSLFLLFLLTNFIPVREFLDTKTFHFY